MTQIRKNIVGEPINFRGLTYAPVNEQFELVDVVLLTNLKYFHSEARQYHDWSLKDAFLLPCVNPHGRRSLVFESVHNGLCIFDHHLSRFTEFKPKWNQNDMNVPDSDVLENLKVIHYIVKQLAESERTRFFPIKPKK